MKILLKKSQVSSSKSSSQITRIWAQDGWCYIPELSQRQRFSVVGEFLEMEHEIWRGVIPMPEYQEAIQYCVYGQQPLTWQEGGQGWTELYEEVVPNHSKTTTCQTPPLPQKPLHP